MSESREEVFMKLQDIFRRDFGDPSLVLEPWMTAKDIKGWDSHSQINMILDCEDVFGVRLKTRDINALENVNEMVNHIIKALSRG